MRAFKNLIWRILNFIGWGGMLQLHLTGALKDDGWFKSFHQKKSIDAQGKPIPWYSYPCLDFLQERLKPNLAVFEFGSGNSTLWLAQRCRQVTALEDDQSWYSLIEKSMPPNVQLLQENTAENENGPYAQKVRELKQPYSIIIVDGKDRNNCVKNSVDFLTEEGVIILDDSFRPQYQEAKDFLKDQGFKELPFYGLTPIVAYKDCTSIFYRENNCLGI